MLNMENGQYFYDGAREGVSLSVYPSCVVLADETSLSFDVPASEMSAGVVCTVAGGEAGAYIWNAPESRKFAEIFITVTAAAKRACCAAKRFICGVVRSLKMSLSIRRPSCLRL